MSIITLVLGFLFLIKGADLFVDGASSLAKKFHIPSIIIGLTIVAMGTSLPELSVSLISSLHGHSDMSIANAVGSNIFNILCILGASAFITKLPLDKKLLQHDTLLLLLSSITLGLLAFAGRALDLLDGVILLGIFSYYILRLINTTSKDDTPSVISTGILKIILFILIGAGGIILGGNLVVLGASNIARAFGLSDNLIGLTIVALGTSLPEFVTSIIATKKGELEIALGNVIGSNIFNILFVLGVASLFSPLIISTVTIIDIAFSVGITSALCLMVINSKDLKRVYGLGALIIYALYIVFTIVR